jgi:hypothetical protein
MDILLVEPHFPIPAKSKNHKNFLPIGLLKLYDYYKSIGYNPKLVRGNKGKEEIGQRFRPRQIMVTSLFTYWSEYVKASIEHYKKLFPKAEIIVGGIYASLMPNHCKEYTGCDEVFVGIHEKAEGYASKNHLSYKILDNPHPIDFQIIHASRGCVRKCRFCGTWKIEPQLIFKKSVKEEICSKKLIFYDNNLLENPFIENILNEIIQERENRNFIICESQSGFDGRVLLSKPHLAILLKKAGFINPRIAWDWGFSYYKEIKSQIDVLKDAGYRNNEIYVFMVYNWDLPFKEMEKKRVKCWEWKVQIADCRFRPLDQVFDNYDPRKVQTDKDYFIHKNWSDQEVKQFRRNVRRHNICIRQSKSFHSKLLEHQRISKKTARLCSRLSENEVLKIIPDAWYPSKLTSPGV